jgi:UDP-glucuronate decarboxylase
MNYHRHYRMPMVIARIFNTYGPRMRKSDGRVISNFIDAALHDEPLKIYGNGDQTRSFCYVDDLVEGLIAAMNSKNIIGPINIGNDAEITVLELAQKIIRLCGSNSLLTNVALPSDDPRKRRPDLSLAHEKIQYYPKVEIDTGLQKTIDFSRSLG